MTERLEGYEKAVRVHNKKAYIERIAFGDKKEMVVDQVATFLSANKEIDAVIFATNYLAISGLVAIRQLGLQIPGQIGVVAFDEHDIYPLFSPAITAIAQPVEEIAENLIKILMKNLDEVRKPTLPESMVLSTTLIVRESSLNQG
jgi:LacI family transcriptional regulator